MKAEQISKVVIAGSRWIPVERALEEIAEAIIATGWRPDVVIHGGNAGFNEETGELIGVDQAADIWARNHGCDALQRLPDWHRLGRRAGPARNDEMAAIGDAAIAIWDGISRGTIDLVNRMRKRGRPVHLRLVAGPIPDAPIRWLQREIMTGREPGSELGWKCVLCDGLHPIDHAGMYCACGAMICCACEKQAWRHAATCGRRLA